MAAEFLSSLGHQDCLQAITREFTSKNGSCRKFAGRNNNNNKTQTNKKKTLLTRTWCRRQVQRSLLWQLLGERQRLLAMPWNGSEALCPGQHAFTNILETLILFFRHVCLDLESTKQVVSGRLLPERMSGQERPFQSKQYLHWGSSPGKNMSEDKAGQLLPACLYSLQELHLLCCCQCCPYPSLTQKPSISIPPTQTEDQGLSGKHLATLLATPCNS